MQLKFTQSIQNHLDKDFDIKKAINYNPNVLFIPLILLSELICFLYKLDRNKLFPIYLIFTVSLFLIYLYRTF